MSGSSPDLTTLGWTHGLIGTGTETMEIWSMGEGDPVIMHPSLGRSAEDFADLGKSVADAGYQVVLINPRGIGGSVGTMDGATLHNLADDVWSVVDHFGFDRIFMLGQNFGNRVARTVSTDQPERVKGLLLLAAGGEVDPGPDLWQEFFKVFDASLPAERHLQAVARSFFAPGNDASVWREGWFGETARAQMEAAKRTELHSIYTGGTAPALVIQGLQDQIAPPINAWNFVQHRENARLVALPNMGHAMLPEQPQVIASEVIAFLASVK